MHTESVLRGTPWWAFALLVVAVRLVRNLAIFAAKYGLAVAMARAPRLLGTLLAVLVVLGLQALRERSVAPWRLLVVPAVFFIGWLLRLFSSYRSARAGRLQPAN